MVAILNIEAQNNQDKQQQWVFGNPQVVVPQAWNMQSWHLIGIFPSVSMTNFDTVLSKTPPR
jgi:hypothetical protein